jgi:lysophospholipase L1-like esterase
MTRPARRIAAAGLLAGVAAAALALATGFLPVGRTPAAPADRPLPRLALSAAPLRIVAFGTSLTQRPGWPEALEARLAACLDRPVTLVRVARTGAGTTWALGETAAVVAARPDLVLVEFVTNDADIADGIGMAASRANHRALLDALAAGVPGVPVLLMTMSPVNGPLRQLQRPFLAGYDAMLRDLAAERGLALADLAPRWRAAIAADPAIRPPDGLHPAPEAAAAVAAAPLARLIGAAAGRDC